MVKVNGKKGKSVLVAENVDEKREKAKPEIPDNPIPCRRPPLEGLMIVLKRIQSKRTNLKMEGPQKGTMNSILVSAGSNSMVNDTILT